MKFFFFAVLVFQTLTCICVCVCVCAFKSHKDKQVTVVYTWSSSNEYAMFLIILYESVCIYLMLATWQVLNPIFGLFNGCQLAVIKRWFTSFRFSAGSWSWSSSSATSTLRRQPLWKGLGSRAY